MLNTYWNKLLIINGVKCFAFTQKMIYQSLLVNVLQIHCKYIDWFLSYPTRHIMGFTLLNLIASSRNLRNLTHKFILRHLRNWYSYPTPTTPTYTDKTFTPQTYKARHDFQTHRFNSAGLDTRFSENHEGLKPSFPKMRFTSGIMEGFLLIFSHQAHFYFYDYFFRK